MLARQDPDKGNFFISGNLVENPTEHPKTCKSSRCSNDRCFFPERPKSLAKKAFDHEPTEVFFKHFYDSLCFEHKVDVFDQHMLGPSSLTSLLDPATESNAPACPPVQTLLGLNRALDSACLQSRYLSSFSSSSSTELSNTSSPWNQIFVGGETTRRLLEKNKEDEEEDKTKEGSSWPQLWQQQHQQLDHAFVRYRPQNEIKLNLAIAFKRWQNLNIVLPLYLPTGTIVINHPSGSHFYAFPDSEPEAQLLFTNLLDVCETAPSNLRLRIAVIHQCPTFLVPTIARLFCDTLRKLPISQQALRLTCNSLIKQKVVLRSTSTVVYRYDTIGELASAQDKQLLTTILERLGEMLAQVNFSLHKDLEDMVFEAQQLSKCSFAGSAASPHAFPKHVDARAKLGLKFRFSPCKQLKIALREGSPCQLSELDAHLEPHGPPGSPQWTRKLVSGPLLAGELRLERDKFVQMQVDPCFLPEHQLRTRLISECDTGELARVVFVDKSIYPRTVVPKVVNMYGVSCVEASRTLHGANFRNLIALLPFKSVPGQNHVVVVVVVVLDDSLCAYCVMLVRPGLLGPASSLALPMNDPFASAIHHPPPGREPCEPPPLLPFHDPFGHLPHPDGFQAPLHHHRFGGARDLYRKSKTSEPGQQLETPADKHPWHCLDRTKCLPGSLESQCDNILKQLSL